MVYGIKIGSVVQNSVDGIKNGSTLTNADGNYMTVESPVGTDLVVTAGKTLYVGLVIYQASAKGISFEIGYGDDGVANGAVAPTNYVQVIQDVFVTQAGDTSHSCDMIIATIPAGKYPCIRQHGAGTLKVYLAGLEV